MIALGLLLNALAFLLFAGDKAAAKAGRRRIPEASLLFVSLLGGWPGALLAQRTFRHKTRKASFRRAFRLACALNALSVAFFVDQARG